MSFEKTTFIKTQLYICKCNSLEHQMIINFFVDDDEYKEIFVSVHLKNFSLKKRIINSIKYIFGHKSVYGDFEEFILTKEHLPQLKELVNYLEKVNQ